MSAPATRSRERGFFRTMGMFLAIVLGGIAIYLVVIGHSQKQVQIGLLTGLWGVLIGAFVLFGPRRGRADDETPGTSLDTERTSAQRREHELQLEVMLRREIERVLRHELSQLREEVTGLRTDVVENVNGQLRLERIETTRIISSDLENLQHELRRLALSRNAAPPALEGGGFSQATITESRTHGTAPPPPFALGNGAGPGRGVAPGDPGPANRSEGDVDRSPQPRRALEPGGRPPAPAFPAADASRPLGPPGGAAPNGSSPPLMGRSPLDTSIAQPPPPVRPATSPLARSAPAAAASSSPLAPPQRSTQPGPGASPPSAVTAYQPAIRDAQPFPPTAGPFPPGPSGPPIAAGFGSSYPPPTGTPAPPTPADTRPSAPPVIRPSTQGGWSVSRPGTPSSATPPATPGSNPSAPPAARPAAPLDPLSGLPRLSRFEYEWDEPPRRPEPRPQDRSPAPEPGPAESMRRATTPSPYVGRRRSGSDPYGPAFAGDGEPSASGAQHGPPQRPSGAPPNGQYPNGGYPSGGGPNGGGPNGAQRYGAAPNGAASNGPGPNGAASNGVYGSGSQPYGGQPSGPYPGGAQPYGGQPNGSQPYGGQPNGAYTNGAPPPNGANGGYPGSNQPGNGNRPDEGSANGNQPSTGRRRRAQDDVNDVLARLLGR